MPLVLSETRNFEENAFCITVMIKHVDATSVYFKIHIFFSFSKYVLRMDDIRSTFFSQISMKKMHVSR